jgi:lipid-A-disaccharide synthase
VNAEASSEPRPLTVMLVAAEASGDALGASLARAVRARLGADKVRFVGVGGAKMAQEGIDSPFDIAELSILGIWESLKAYPRAMARLKRHPGGRGPRKARRRRADRLLGLQHPPGPGAAPAGPEAAAGQVRGPPGLGLSGRAGPRPWPRPWTCCCRSNRWTRPYFDAAGLDSVFVGNSALAHDFSRADPARLRASDRRRARRSDPAGAARQPASEIERVMPRFEDAVHRLKAERPELRVVVPAASTVADRRSRPASPPGRSGPTSSRTTG